MKFSKTFLVILVIVFTNQSFSQNRSINFDHSNWNSLLSRAKTSGKLLFVDCFTTWCGPCKWMAAHVFTNDTVADYFNENFICAKIDMEKGEGLNIAKQYGIEAYPTFIFVNGDGTLIYRLCGSDAPKHFLENSKNALIPEKQIANSKNSFNNGNCSGTQAIQYLNILAAGCQNTGAGAQQYFNTQKEADYTSRVNWTIINTFVNEYDSPQIQYLEKNQALFSKLYGIDSVSQKLNAIYAEGLYKAIDKPDVPAYGKLKRKIKSSGSKNADQLIAETDMYYYSKNNDWKNYALKAISYIEKHAADNAGMLNNCAWNFYEHVDNKTQLEKACKWSQRSCELSQEYANADTYAAILYKTGKYDEAKKYALLAIELAKKEGSEYNETQKLLDKINLAK